ncbi:MAG: FecR domain-containing protein [Myxococcota bacterium]
MTPVRRFVEETEAGDGAVARVAVRLRQEVPDADTRRGLLAELPDGGDEAVARVRARLHKVRRPVLPVLAGAAAAIALIGVSAIAATLWLQREREDLAPLSAQLASEDARSALQPTDEVRLYYQGAGALGGTRWSPRVDWQVGRLVVEVAPDRGVDLRVHTREADVRVVGTGFTVDRDALGTHVAVQHGRVAVICADGGEFLLSAGRDASCLPTHAGALLGRARALQDAAAPPADVLDAAERGLAAGAKGGTRHELQLLRVEMLIAAGRPADALAAAEAYLAEGTSLRRTEVRRMAAYTAMTTGGCAAALPHLQALVDGDATGPELVQFADCILDSRPDDARTALTRALRLGAPPEQENAIIERLTRLNAHGRP